jgi:hypothetical protein
MTTSFAPLTVAIGDLVPHTANVRSNSPETYDPENIAHLKASIAVLGLLQPLLVQKRGVGKTWGSGCGPMICAGQPSIENSRPHDSNVMGAFG